jgi:hypothetical protein
MKKLLTVLVALLVVVSMFAAKFPLTMEVEYAGSATFSLLIDEAGIDISGALSFTTAPKLNLLGFTQPNASLSLSFSMGTWNSPTVSLTEIRFSTPNVGFRWNASPYFINDYFAGVDNNGRSKLPSTSDVLKVDTKLLPGLELYYADLNNAEADREASDVARRFFNDLVIVKYPVAGFNIFGALWKSNPANDADAYEWGVSANGTVDLGVIKPSVTVFFGMVEGATPIMLNAVDVNLKASYSMAGLTLEPQFKYGENLDKLNYKSDSVTNEKYVQVVTSYGLKVDPVEFAVKVTPKYTLDPATLTVKLDQVKVAYNTTPFTVSAAVSNDNLLDASKKYKLDVTGKVVVDPVTVNFSGNWADITELATYTYLRADATIKATDKLTLTGMVNMVTDTGTLAPRSESEKVAYRLQATYNYGGGVTSTFFFGNLFGPFDGKYRHYKDPRWYVEFRYTTSF